MFFASWRTRRAMQDPIAGEFRVASWYDPNPNGSPRPPMLTGVVLGPGLQPVAVECRADSAGKWAGNAVLPALIDRTNPTRFVVLWKQVTARDWKAEARAQAQQAAANAERDQQF